MCGDKKKTNGPALACENVVELAHVHRLSRLSVGLGAVAFAVDAGRCNHEPPNRWNQPSL